MRGCYFVIPTTCIRLRSEATPVQHNAFQKRFDLCCSLQTDVFTHNCESRVSFLSLMCFVAAICSRSAGFSFMGSGWWCFLAAGMRGLDPSSVVCWCVWLLRQRVPTALVQASAQTCTNTGTVTKTHKQACILANYFRTQLPGGAADLEQHNMKDCSFSTYCAQAAAPSFFLFSASESLERTPSLA